MQGWCGMRRVRPAWGLTHLVDGGPQLLRLLRQRLLHGTVAQGDQQRGGGEDAQQNGDVVLRPGAPAGSGGEGRRKMGARRCLSAAVGCGTRMHRHGIGHSSAATHQL